MHINYYTLSFFLRGDYNETDSSSVSPGDVNFILQRNKQGAHNWLAGFTLAGALLSSLAFSVWEQRSFYFFISSNIWDRAVVALVREGPQIPASLPARQLVFREGKKKNPTKAFRFWLRLHQKTCCLVWFHHVLLILIQQNTSIFIFTFSSVGNK